MKVLRTIQEVRDWRAQQESVGFVPTMGALHEGHLSLMRESASQNSATLISIFVNPTQFGPNEDLSKYPRQEAQDLDSAQSAGVNAAFLPSVEEMYPDNPAISISVGQPALLYEGERRPGHFNGVATVVAKLFNIAQATRAYFGLKDLQQCAVIRALVDELAFDLELVFIETVREKSGLALSSRNAYLSETERSEASALFMELESLAHRLSGGVLNNRASIEKECGRAVENLIALNFRPEYVDFVNPVTMQPLHRYEESGRIIAAAQFCAVRLIDNIAVT